MNDMFCFILEDARRGRQKAERRLLYLAVAATAYVVYSRISAKKQKDRIAELMKENEELKYLKGE